MNRKDQDTAQQHFFVSFGLRELGTLTRAPAIGRRGNAKTETWKKQSGSISYWAGLHGTELRLRAHAAQPNRDRKSTRLNSSHANISYAVFCLKKKKKKKKK